MKKTEKSIFIIILKLKCRNEWLTYNWNVGMVCGDEEVLRWGSLVLMWAVVINLCVTVHYSKTPS